MMIAKPGMVYACKLMCWYRQIPLKPNPPREGDGTGWVLTCLSLWTPPFFNKFVERKILMKHKYFLKTLLLFVLYSGLVFIVPQYVECNNSDSDELLDLFGIIKKSVDSSTILTKHAPEFYNLYSNTHSIQHHPSENFYFQPFTSELVSSVIFRC